MRTKGRSIVDYNFWEKKGALELIRVADFHQ
jgi:hypothetical protein